MSGTIASLSSTGGGILLPAPMVQTFVDTAIGSLLTGDRSASNGGTINVAPMNYVRVVTHGIAQEVLDNTDLELRLELLRYTRRASRINQAAGNGTKNGGFVHPAHGPGASGNGSFTHGGDHGGTSAVVQALRETEWAVTGSQQIVHVSQGMLAFMAIGPIQYLDLNGNGQLIDGIYPTTNWSNNWRHGRRYPYDGLYSPGYFKFRYSVRDLSDSRVKRIHGPLSDTVSLTNEVFPFIPDTPNSGRATAFVDGRYDAKSVRFYVGSTSRLPR